VEAIRSVARPNKGSLPRAPVLYAIGMGRSQKLTNTAGKAFGKIRKAERSKAQSKRLKAVNGTIEGDRARGRGGEISRDSVSDHALATFGSSEKAQHWMTRPNPLFHGKTPAEVIEFDPVGVEAELVRIDHGVYM
jgi:Protein of unknown function (DUF2384)